MAPLSVLIIDDNEVDAELLHQIVERHAPGAQVTWVWDGLEALVRVGLEKPHLVFLDYMMPKTDGMDFLRSIRTLDALKGTRICVVSAFVEPGNRQQFLDLGANHVLSKPVQMQDVVDVINEAAKRRS
ncbi:MAG: response regulator [Deltaproteobacteria bacterium]|nr:response regulator [Deltaproteobacteria bacterium]